MKINYGIFIGTSSASIAKMEADVPIIIRSSDKMEDTTPIAVSISHKGIIFSGAKAYDAWKTKSKNQNSFIDFTRTLGSDKEYFSSNANRSFSSEELLAVVLNKLICYEKDIDINAAVITVPSAYKSNQINAVRKAGCLAGLKQVEIITEDQAAALAYGLDAEWDTGYSLVFKFTSRDFNTTLIKTDNDILSIIDTEGDNYLGGINLDYAIVDQLIIPHIKEKFSIDDLLSDDIKKEEFRTGLKFFAEEIKNNLSFNSSHNIYVDPGECGVDDEEEAIEIDLTITQQQLKNVLAPIFQEAINICLILLKRHNLQGADLKSLILAGKPTYSPILRDMLTDQICKPDTSIDPESVIVKGAAIYASRINLNDEVKNYNKNSTKIQLEIGHEPSSLESDVFVTLKILEDKTEGEIPEKVFAEIKRSDNAWESGKVEINTIGEVIDVKLNEGKTNVFRVTIYDDNGNYLESEPISFSVIQGSKIGSTTLPYNIGTEIIPETSSKILFKTIPGLEKNQSLPAIGTLKYINIDKDIRPGIVSDVIKIPFYQGDYGSEGTRAIYHDHIFDITISGTDLPCLLPKNSDIELTIVVDEYQSIATQAYFPSIDYTCGIEVSTCLNNSIESGLLIEEAKKAKEVVSLLKGDKHQSYEEKLIKAESVIDAIEQYFDNNRNNIDEKLKLLTDLRKTLAIIDELIENAYWPKLESDLKKEFIKIEEISSSYKIETISNSLALLKSQLDDVLIIKDLKLGKDLLHGLIDEIRRIDAINERHDREYLQLFENGDLTLFEVKKSLEEANRQNGVVYHEVLELINQEYKNLTKEKVEELLFQLTEDGLIPATIFQECFELLSTTNDDAGSLVRLYINIKSYDSK